MKRIAMGSMGPAVARRLLAVCAFVGSAGVGTAGARPAEPAPSAAPPSPSSSGTEAPPAVPRPRPVVTPTPPDSAALAAQRWQRADRWLAAWRAGRSRHRALRLQRLRVRLQRALGGAPPSEALLAELREHARRVARLERVKEVAVGEQDRRSFVRAEDLLRREHGRHHYALEALLAKAPRAEDAGR